MEKTLKDLRIGEKGIISSVESSGEALRRHLLDLGLVPGAEVQLVKAAPMGDPIEILIHGYELTLRRHEAAGIGISEPATGSVQADSTSKDTDSDYNFYLHEHNSHPGLGESGKYHSKDHADPMPKNAPLRLAIVGQHNSGKTALFNYLTGESGHVGNFPGVTVEVAEAPVKGHANTTVADLPGIYSLQAYSEEEKITRDFILKEKPNGIINIIDANHLERSLYLTVQLMELGIPMALALNMMDEVTNSGGTIRINELEKLLGIPVVPISVNKGNGISEFMDHMTHVATYREKPAFKGLDNAGSILSGADGADTYARLATERYNFIEQICRATVIKPRETKKGVISQKIDRILTGRWTAIPAFLVIMCTLIWLTVDVIGAWLQRILDGGITVLAAKVGSLLAGWEVAGWMRRLVVEAIFGGVGSVLSFLPIVITLFFFLSMLEDSGYMARIAFVSDKMLRRIGLSGRSIVPLLFGFGCSVPGVMAARTLPSARDRKATILLMPFMSCSAKIAIYTFFIVNFFPGHAAAVMISLYLLGILVGIAVALVRKWRAKNYQPAPFVMEMPVYRLPRAANVGQLLWDKTNDFLQISFTVIFLASIVVWFLQSFSFRFDFVTDSSESMLAAIAGVLAPLFKPLGLGDWRIVTSLICGFMAKESVVSTMEVLSVGSLLTVQTAVPMLIFCLLYTPCVAATAAIRRELGRGWAAFVVVFQCLLAWLCAWIGYMITCLIV
ncbi:MAG: ferrous iron transport protein B [Bacteroidales bacterium]|nr:ferrous iron transport protein B [Candidatus Equibacterium intestinale]